MACKDIFELSNIIDPIPQEKQPRLDHVSPNVEQ
jgi:hypothetical protein